MINVTTSFAKKTNYRQINFIIIDKTTLDKLYFRLIKKAPSHVPCQVFLLDFSFRPFN